MSSSTYQPIHHHQLSNPLSSLPTPSSASSSASSFNTAYELPHESQDESIKVEQHLRSLALREQSRRRALRHASSFVLLPNSPIIDLEPFSRALGFSPKTNPKPIHSQSHLRTSALSKTRHPQPTPATLFDFSTHHPSLDQSSASDRTYKPASSQSTSPSTSPILLDQSKNPLLSQHNGEILPKLLDDSLDDQPIRPVIVTPKGVLHATQATTDEERSVRAERVHSAFIEHCEWTTSPPASAYSRPPLPTHPEESTDTLQPHPSGVTLEPVQVPIAPFQRSSLMQYLSGISIDTVTAFTNSRKSSDREWSPRSPDQPHPRMRMSTSERHLLGPSRTESFFDEFDDDGLEAHNGYPGSRLNDRKIGIMDWILCGCWISDEDLEGEQAGRTGPE